jgi:hypothetical protein
MSGTMEDPGALLFDSHGDGNRNAPFHIYDKRLHVGRQLQTRSHSLTSVIPPGPPVASAVMITILPVLSISMRAICTPAAVTALTALVTSCCRNVEGARATASYRGFLRGQSEPRASSVNVAAASTAEVVVSLASVIVAIRRMENQHVWLPRERICSKRSCQSGNGGS